MHQHIATEHRPLGHHRLMPRRMPRRRHQPHPAQRGLPLHHPQLPRLHDRPDHPLVRRPTPHVLDLIPLHHVLRIRETAAPHPPHSTPHDPDAHASTPPHRPHRPNPSHLQQPRQPPTHPQPLSRLPTSRPHPRINQHHPRIPSHQITMKMQPPPSPAHVPRHHLGRPLRMLSTPPRQRLRNPLRKHRHRITQHRHVHAAAPPARPRPLMRPSPPETPTRQGSVHRPAPPQLSNSRSGVTQSPCPTRSSKNARTQSVE